MSPNSTLSAQKQSFFSRLGKDLKKHHGLYFLALPAVIALFFLNYVPMYGVIIAFKDYRPVLGIWGSEWAGLHNFERFFNSYQFKTILTNTIAVSFESLLFSFPIPIILALLLNQIHRARLKKGIQTLVYLPHFISVVVMVSMVKLFLQPTLGLIGAVYNKLGISDVPNFMAMKTAFRPIFIISSIWQHAGWDSIIYIAALSGIDPTLYEAAAMDGASKFQRVLHIDLPGILPTIVICLILHVGKIMNVSFDRAYLLQNDLNISVSEIIQTYVYKLGIKQAQYSYSSVIGLFNNIVNLILLLIVNTISKKTTDTGLW